MPLPNEGFIAVAGGREHSLGLKADGSIAAWGHNDFGQCDVPEPNEGFIAVTAGYWHSLGLKADGSIATWGSNSDGQCNVPEPNKGFIAVAGGALYNLGLKGEAAPMDTAFTYQGRLIDANSPADGLYDFQFKLFDDPCAGAQQGGTIDVNDLDVIDGYFTVGLDFSSNVFTGDARWLEIGVRTYDPCDVNGFTTLQPRTELTPTPYAIYAKTAGGGITGSGTANYLPKFINSNTVGNSVIYESGGKVGIGTSSPFQKLDVLGNTFVSGNIGIGTVSPQAALHVNPVAGRAGMFTIGSSTSTVPVLYALTPGPGAAVLGEASNDGVVTNYGGSFKAAGEQGRGVYGAATASSGTNYGVYGTTYSIDGYGGYFEGGRNYFEGNVGIGTTSPSEKLDVDGTARLRGISEQAGATYVHVDGNGKMWKITSSKKYKTNIRDLSSDPTAVLELRPVKYQCRISGKEDVGLIAEEVEQVIRDLVIHNDDGSPEAVKYDRVSLYLLGVVKELKAENELLKQRLEALERTMQQLAKAKEVKL